MGFEDYYEVSSYGRVRSKDRITIYKNGNKHLHKGKILSAALNVHGYRKVSLSVNGVSFTKSVCRLVAIAFLPNPFNLPQVNHIDENKLNDNVCNLEWCTPKYNMNYGSVKERRAEKRKKGILQFTADGAFVREWDSATSAERELGISHSHIAKCCRGKANQTGNYIWKYKDVLYREITNEKV